MATRTIVILVLVLVIVVAVLGVIWSLKNALI